MQALLVSTYEMGRQPFGLASPAAWLRAAGVTVTCLDLSRQPFDSALASRGAADLVAFHLPMHTATRLAIPVIKRVRELNPEATLCCYGLYAPLNAELLQSLGVQRVLGGEYEADLVRVAIGQHPPGAASATMALPRLAYRVPDRTGLPEPRRYATLQHGPIRRTVAYTEASRGCKHHCTHCPIVPVYDGQFRVVPADIVLDDIRRQVDLGAEHVTFGDPDFFNGIGHARRVVDGFAREFPGLTYDVTIKIEHLLQHRDQLARLAASGCLFVTSAVESFDDDVLTTLRKGHTAADVERAVVVCRDEGLTLVPTFVPFAPWTSLGGYRDFLTTIDRLDLVDHVASIQLAIRLLVPQGSRLLDLSDIRQHLQAFDADRLVYPWRHPDPRVDALSEGVAELVGRRLRASRRDVFGDVWALANVHSDGQPQTRRPQSRRRVEVPYLNEPWYC